MKYVIAFRRNSQIGTEEYDGGNTIADARKEAEFFAAHIPEGTRIRICTVDRHGDLVTKEDIQSTGANLAAA